MQVKFGLLFWIYKSRKNEQLESPVMLRVTLNRERWNKATGIWVNPKKWFASKEKVKGEGADLINERLSAIKTDMQRYFNELVRVNDTPTIYDFRILAESGKENGKTLLQVFHDHIQKMKALEGKEYAKATVIRYQTTLGHLKAFIKKEYDITDLSLRQVNYEFLTKLEHYFKITRSCNHNTAAKYIKNFKKVVNICLKSGWLDKDPFAKYKITIKPVNKEFLSQLELDNLAAKKITNHRLERVRDIFLFCCYTGFAYVDVFALKNEHIKVGVDQQLWIVGNRTKTHVRVSIPLLPPALKILDKYTDAANTEIIFQCISNQKMNAYLKEIADICGINKNLTSHMARHTFATTVTLSNGVPIETVSKMLGHTNLKTTQIYAKVVDTKISDDMQVLKRKLSGTSKSQSDE
jgi:site-specific recombinase XerD